MARILFMNQSSIGHLNTLLTIALQMQAEGHSVSFVVPGIDGPDWGIPILKTANSVPRVITQNGIAVRTVKPPFSLLARAIYLPLTTGYREIITAVQIFSTGTAHYTRAIMEEVERQKPDAIVSDFGFFAGAITAELARIPYITIYHSGLPFRGPNIPPFGSGLPIVPDHPQRPEYEAREQKLIKIVDRKINAARAEFGLPPMASDILRRPYSPWLNLITSVEAIEAPRSNLTPETYYIGPCFSTRRSTTSTFPFDQLDANRCKVYVSLGTVFNNKPYIFRRIMQALDHPDYQVIISAGASYAPLMKEPRPTNVMLFPSVPQVDLLPKVDLVIGHGGNNSTNETLAAGKPLVVIPVGGEQGDNARRVEYLGAGLGLDIHTLQAEDVRQAVQTLRDTPRYRETAERLSQQIALTDGAAVAARCIAWVARTQSPLRRPPDAPLTITQDAAIPGMTG